MEKRPLSPKKKMLRIAAGIIALLILFLYYSTYFTKTENTETDLNYGLEKRLAAALEKMQGVGEVQVVINYESTAESVPVEATGEERLFSQEPYIVKQNMPQVRGVLVVAEGAEDIRIRTELLYAVTALLDVDAAKVEILY